MVERIGAARGTAAATLRGQADALRILETAIAQEQVERWQKEYDEARSSYEALRDEMTERGVEFSQHEKLLQRRAQLERELALLESTDHELKENEGKVARHAIAARRDT